MGGVLKCIPSHEMGARPLRSPFWSLKNKVIKSNSDLELTLNFQEIRDFWRIHFWIAKC